MVDHVDSDMCNWYMHIDGQIVHAYYNPLGKDIVFDDKYSIPKWVVGSMGGVEAVSRWLYDEIIVGGKDFATEISKIEAGLENPHRSTFILFEMGTPDPRSYTRNV